jgi:hypothetical protein
MRTTPFLNKPAATEICASDQTLILISTYCDCEVKITDVGLPCVLNVLVSDLSFPQLLAVGYNWTQQAIGSSYCVVTLSSK